MAQPIPGGVWPAVVTCWNEQEDRPDLDKQTVVVEHFIKEGLDGLYVLGSTGRGPSLSVEHRQEVAAHVAKVNRGRLPLMIHVGGTSHRDAVALARHAAACGADAISSVPPLYFPADTEMIFEHYRLIAQATDLPFFPYHHQGLGVAMPDAVEYARRLMALPHIGGIKFTSSDYFTFMRIRARVGSALVLFSGADELMCHGALSSADGAIGTFYNVWGRAVRRVRQRYLEGDVALGQRFSLAFAQALEQIISPRRRIPGWIRTAMALRCGVDIGAQRSAMDLAEMTWERSEVQAMVEAVDQAAGL